MSGNLKGSGGDIAPFSQSSFPWKKAVSAIYGDGTHILCHTAGYLLAVSVSTDATGPGQLHCYDGHNAAGREVWHEQSLANHGHSTVFKVPVYCDRGITIVCLAVTHCSIQWLPGPRLP